MGPSGAPRCGWTRRHSPPPPNPAPECAETTRTSAPFGAHRRSPRPCPSRPRVESTPRHSARRNPSARVSPTLETPRYPGLASHVSLLIRSFESVSPTDRPLPAQRRAIEAPLGPLLVIAGPGAGKTYCLVGRVDHLIRRLGMAPRQICAVTFTNKAAEEIATRLHGVLGPAVDEITRGTLHALCAGILRDHAEAAGLRPAFGVADEEYQRVVLRRLRVRRERWTGLLNRFGRARLAVYSLHGDEMNLLRTYLAALRERNMVDFDDLICLTADLFIQRPDIANEVAARWRCLLVDEGQDLDPTQYTILKRLAAGHRNLFIVGDDEQSIFSWRGAAPVVLAEFQRDFGIGQPIVLDYNRRCSRQIFDTARRLVEENRVLFEKQISADRDSAHEVRALLFPDERAEAEWIVADVMRDRAQAGRGWGAYAVLFRKHDMATPLERQFLAAGIPCRLAPRRAAADDPVIGYVVAALRVMLTLGDGVAQETFAALVLPDALLETLRSKAGEEKDFVATVREFARRNPRGDPDTKRAWRFIYHIENLGAMYRAHGSVPGIVQELLAQRVGKYRNVLEECYQELTDPAEHVEACRLAERLRETVAADGRVWVHGSAGLDIALRGMLVAAGYAPVSYAEDGPEPQIGDLTIGPADESPQGIAVTLFKALQLRHASDLDEGFRDCVVFDLETTDVDAATCEVVELAAVRVRAGQVTETFHTLIRPDKRISPGATAVHGYLDADVADAPRFVEVWPRFISFVGSHVLVAHNAQRFDIPVLQRMARGLDGVEHLTFFDTLPLARALSPDSAKLANLAARFGVAPGRAHRALDDAQTLAAVFRELVRRKLIRARTTCLVNVLDFLGLGLALQPDVRRAGESKLLYDIASAYTLGRYSNALSYYAEERERRGRETAPALEEIVELLGGRERMERLQSEPDPARRYPLSMARLDGLIEASAAPTVAESIQLLLDLVALSTSSEVEVDPHRVSLLTLHATKGLEFDCVYVVGAEDGELPGLRAGADMPRSEMEEARRLLYVGMTRARDRLVLTRAHERRGLPGGGNRFLDEMGLKPVYVDPVTAP